MAVVHFLHRGWENNNMTADINNYIMPLFRRMGDVRSFAGTTFCIENYLVTAGHVLTTDATYYVLNGDNWPALDHAQWIPQQLPISDKHGVDVAFFPVPGLRSPLTMAQDNVKPNDSLDVVCWQFKPWGLTQVSTQCLVLKEPDEEGYLRIATVDRITHGSSGCPVMRHGKVYGILTMGRDMVDSTGMTALKRQMEEHTCWAFKTEYAMRFLR